MNNLSLKWKFIFTSVLAIACIQIVGGFYDYYKWKQELQTALDNKGKQTATNLAKMGAISIAEFDLPNLEKLVKDAGATDQEILYSAYFDSEGNKIVESGILPAGSHDSADFRGDIYSPSDSEKKIGFVQVDFTTKPYRQKLFYSLTTTVVQTLLVFLILGFLTYGLFYKLIDSRLSVIVKGISEIAKGNFDVRLAETPPDELGSLGGSVNKMAGDLQGLLAMVENKNIELKDINSSLEQKVEERTATIKVILNNVKSGFFLMDQSYQILDGYTKSCTDLFSGSIETGKNIGELLGLSQRSFEHFKACYGQVFDDILPEAVAISQAPQRFEFKQTVLKIEGSVVRDQARTVKNILFTVTDITELQRIEKEHALSQCIIKILKLRDSFVSFIKDSRSALFDLRSLVKNQDHSKIRMILHTLKGNSATFGLVETANLIHHLEDQPSWTLLDVDAIEFSFKKFLSDHQNVLNVSFDPKNSGQDTVTLDFEAVTKLQSAVEKADDSESAAAILRKWSHEIRQKSARELLGPLEELVNSLKLRLGKQVTLNIKNPSIKMDPDVMVPVMRNLTHLIRNSMDHGIENPLERKDKPLEGNITISFFDLADHWEILFSDDGRGIDADKITEKAIQAGLLTVEQAAQLTREEKLYLILKENISTAASVSDLSGRGSGMAALANSIHEAGGQLKIRSEANQGCQFHISIPKHFEVRLPEETNYRKASKQQAA